MKKHSVTNNVHTVTLARRTKAATRRQALDRRSALDPAFRRRSSGLIRERLLGLPQVAQARTLLGFAAHGSEVNLDPLLDRLIADGRGVFLPFIETLWPPVLGIARVRDLADLEPGHWGVREPRAATRRPARADRLDVVCAPGVAFDLAGRRLGHGTGFYDRLLSRLGPATAVVAVGFEAQIVDHLPEEAHDRRVHLIITEARVITPAAT